MPLDQEDVTTFSFSVRSLIEDFERLEDGIAGEGDLEDSYTFVSPQSELTLEKVVEARESLERLQDKGVLTVETDIAKAREDDYFHSTRHARATYIAEQISRFDEASIKDDRTVHLDALNI